MKKFLYERQNTAVSKMSNFLKSEFSKTEHAQKTPVEIANEGQRTGAVRIATAFNESTFLLFYMGNHKPC